MKGFFLLNVEMDYKQKNQGGSGPRTEREGKWNIVKGLETNANTK